MINHSFIEAANRNDPRPCLTGRGLSSLIAFQIEREMIEIVRMAAYRALGVR